MSARILWDETKREDALRIVSFRPASEEERSGYHGWLENDFNDDR